MKLKISNKWIMVLITVIIPALLMVAAITANSGICIFMTLLIWIGVVLIVAFIPYYKE
ncbi:MAG TPA: hypothetical protein VLH13_00225 [Methanomassiliicoccales archaeon]|nr:hypothetical protein [Methanomassiliicoccales archaeon]